MQNRRSLLLFLIVFISINSFAQNWDLVNPNYKYNYIRNNSDIIQSTFWVDSLSFDGKDTTFYLNRIIKDCDTCHYTISQPPIAYYDQPQFLQREVIKSDAFYTFKSPHTFVINYKAQINDSWVFDTVNNITANILSVSQANLFGQDDSIKTIGLSDNETIIQSKNFGIIRFYSKYDSCKYELVGIDDIIGKSVPDFFDFYNFSVGDIFEYHGTRWVTESDTKFFIEKTEIESKKQNGDTLEYGVTIQYYQRTNSIPPQLWYSQDYASSQKYSNTLKYVNTPSHPTNRYNNQLIKIEDYLEENRCSYDYQFTRLTFQVDSNDVFTKSIGGSWYTNNFFSICDTLKKTLCISSPLCDEHEISYKVGLGEVHHNVSGFEWTFTRDLVAYKTKNDTIGTFTPDEDLVVHANEIEFTNIRIYPNPVTHELQIENNTGKKLSIRIIDITGRTIIDQPLNEQKSTINLNASAGVYSVLISDDTGQKKLEQKIIKK